MIQTIIQTCLLIYATRDSIASVSLSCASTLEFSRSLLSFSPSVNDIILFFRLLVETLS